MFSKVEEITAALSMLAAQRHRVIIAIDGRCAAGKTTFAEQLGVQFGYTVFHTDDFFLRPEQRTAERLDIPGENIDHERFSAEILLPLRRGEKHITYQSYDCHAQSLRPPITIPVGTVSIIEGSYSCHPELWDSYDLHIFLTVSKQEQLRRIIHRNGEAGATIFRDYWIPLEERYFLTYQIAERCDWCMDTSEG